MLRTSFYSISDGQIYFSNYFSKKLRYYIINLDIILLNCAYTSKYISVQVYFIMFYRIYLL